MTQDEIIEMAQECRLIGMRPHLDGIYSEALVAFAKLVAEKALKDHAMREVQRLGQEIEQEPVAWLLTDKKINSLQVDDIQRLIDRLKHAHHTDLCVRINGQDEWFEADWLKHMVRAAPPQRKPLTDEAQVLRILLGAALGALRYHTEQTRPIQRTNETIAAIEHELAAHGIKENT